MFKKIAALATAAVLCAGLMAGCGASSTTADTSYSAENPLVLTLAHGLSEAHTVHIAMTQFAEEVNEKTDGRVQVKIFPNGQLGSENENLEQLQAGVIAMTKVSAPGLATYNDAFNTFGLRTGQLDNCVVGLPGGFLQMWGYMLSVPFQPFEIRYPLLFTKYENGIGILVLIMKFPAIGIEFIL